MTMISVPGTQYICPHCNRMTWGIQDLGSPIRIRCMVCENTFMSRRENDLELSRKEYKEIEKETKRRMASK